MTYYPDGISLKQNNKPSIRTRLAVLGAACLLPALIAAAGILVHHYQLQRAQLIVNTVDDARSLRNSFDSEMAAVQTTLQALATSPSLQNRDFSAFQAQASQVLTLSIINNIALIAPGGQQIVNTAVPFGQALPLTGIADMVDNIISTGQPIVSELRVGALLKRPLISVAVPVRMGQSVTYVLSGVVVPAHLQKLITNSSQPADRIVAIFDGAGIIGARSLEPDRFVGKSVAPGLASRLKEVNEGAIEVLTLEGISVLSVFSRSATTRWGAAIGIPVQTLTAQLHRSMWQLGIATTLLLGLGIGLAWFMGGRISRGIDKLIQPALDLAHGKAVSVSGLFFKEAEALGQALMQTSVVLESTSNALKNSETRLRAILQSAKDAIIAVDDDQQVVLFNAAACAMFECTVEQAMHRQFTQFIPQRFHSHHFAYVEKNRIRKDETEVFGVAGVAIGLRSTGEEFPMEVSYSNVISPDGTFHTLIIRDITKRLQTLKALEGINP